MGSIVSDLLTKGGEVLTKVLDTKISSSQSGKIGNELLSGGGNIERFGSEAASFWGLLKDGIAKGEELAGPDVADYLSATKGVSKDTFKPVVAELKKGPISSGLGTVIRQKMSNIFDEYANRTLVDPAEKKVDYWPEMHPQEKFVGKGRESSIQHLIKTNQARNTAEAEALLNRTSSGGRIFPNIERPRLANLPGAREDMAVPLDYIAKGWKRIAEHDTFGRKDEKLTDMLEAVKQAKGQEVYENVKWIGEMTLGRRIGAQGPVPGLGHTQVEKAVSSLEALAHLSMATASRVTHVGNLPIVVRGFTPVIRGMANMMADSGAARDFAIRTGPMMREAYQDARREFLGEWSLGGKMLQYTQFTRSDRAIRMVATQAGKAAAEDYAKVFLKNGDKEAEKTLRILGVDVGQLQKTKMLSAEDIAMAARRAHDLSQYTGGVENVPPAWRATPIARMLTLYKNFMFYEAKFVKDQIIKPAFKGDMKPLLYASIIFPTLGEVSADLKEYMKRGNLDERPNWNEFPADRIVDNLAHVGAIGLFYDTARSLSYNDASAFWRFLGGPALSDVVDVGHMVGQTDLTAEHPFDKMTEEAKRKLTQSIPVVGPTLYDEYWRKKTARTQSMLQRGKVTELIHKVTSK